MILALDTETTGGDFFHGSRPYIVTTCDDTGAIRYWEWPVDPRTRRPDIPKTDVYEIRDLIDTADRIVGQNLRFDVHALKTIGIEFDADDWAKVDDTLIAGHLLNSSTPHDLTSMIVQYLDDDISGLEKDLEKACKAARDWARRNRPAWRIAKEKQPDMPSAKEQTWKIDAWLPVVAAEEQGLPANHAWRTVTAKYANADSGGTLKLWYTMKELLERRRLYAIYQERMRLVPVIWRMENRGVTVHAGRLNQLRDEYRANLQEMIQTLVAMAEAEGHALTVPKAGNNQSLLDLCFGWAEVRCDVCQGAVRIPRGNVPKAKEMEAARTKCRRCREAGTARIGYPRVHEYPLLDLPITIRTDTGAPSLNKEARTIWLDELPDGPVRNFVSALSAKSKRDTSINSLNAYERFMVPLSGGLRPVASPAATNGKPAAPAGTAPTRRAAVFGAPAVNTSSPILVRSTLDDPWHVLHPNLNPTGTDTLRMSSNNPNGQNVSKLPDEQGFSLRRVFGPAPGREWWPIDYENIELRIPAFEAGEQELMDVFLRPNEPPYFGSYHLVIFELLHPEKFRQFGKRCKAEFESTWYQWVKNGNFAILYGAMERKADATYRVPGAYRRIRGRFPKMAALADRMIALANRTGGVETVPDRNVDPTRGYPIICSRGKRGEILPTVPFNYHIQSTAMWCTARAMVRTDARCSEWRAEGFDAWLALQVHDEIVFDLPAGGRRNLPRVKELVALMEKSGDDIGVPLKAAAKYCPNNWATPEELAVELAV